MGYKAGVPSLLPRTQPPQPPEPLPQNAREDTMVLNTTQPTSPIHVDNNKENVIFKPSPAVLRNANGRRPRSRTHNTPSPIVIAREAARDPARRRTQSPPIVTPTRVFRLAVEDPDVEMAEVTTPSDSTTPQRSIRLPRHLKRPTFRPIPPAAIEAVDPDLKDVAMVYIHQNLQKVGQQLLNVAATTTANPPRDRLPRELEVVINDLSADMPTHLFAVYSKPATRVAIHPAHALVLAAHCANLPSLSHSKPMAPSVVGSRLTLPVVPLCLPNPSTFPILLHYLYTKRGDYLLASLLPMPPRDATQSLDQLARSLAETFTVSALLSYAAKTHGMWSNIAALGVFDEKLSCGVEMVWQVLLEALAISTGSSWRTEKAPAHP